METLESHFNVQLPNHVRGFDYRRAINLPLQTSRMHHKTISAVCVWLVPAPSRSQFVNVAAELELNEQRDLNTRKKSSQWCHMQIRLVLDLVHSTRRTIKMMFGIVLSISNKSFLFWFASRWSW